ncbi:hypothetical protein ANO11243_023210 [Dothideomycetidae sp. 11243]|nr:hypothetical protein ANO11243_023210 [fungal sp. No.11243]
MDLLHDVFALPGSLGAGFGLGRSHSRSDSAVTDVSVSTTSQAPGILSPLRRLLRHSRDLRDVRFAADGVFQTPPPATSRDKSDDTAFRIPALRLQLEQAELYSEWHAAAAELDALEGHDAWKLDDDSSEYDVALIRAKLKEMDHVRLERDQRKMLSLLREGLARNLGGMGSLRLYKHSRLGTKALIERYIQSVLDTIEVLVDITKNGRGNVDSAVALQELLFTRQSFGRSALLLSGGGTFGMNHIGVVKALFEAKLLPRIISGASAGSIVSAVLCSKTDEEIPDVLGDFCHGDLEVFEKTGQDPGILGKAYRFMTQGCLFDIANLTAVMRDLLGDLTFNEAYNRTRRILNICVSAANHYEMPRLLNYLTAPDVMIWSAVAASCSVPFIFSPGQLLVKDRHTGEHVPWNSSARQWIDGSVENDIPTQRLSEMFNVNHFIVSQVNPHVVPFLDKDEKDLEKEVETNHAPRVTKRSLAHRLSTIARDEAVHRLHVVEELGIFPNVFSKIRAVVGQKYAGDITIFPQISYANFPYVLSNPDTEFMIQASLSGERATWPKLSEVRNHCAIELAIDDAVHELIPHHIFGPTQLDNHSLQNLGYPLTMSALRARQLKKRTTMRSLRTSLDLPRLALRGPIKPFKDSPLKAATSHAGKPSPAKKVAGPDLHDFSDSEPESDEDNNGNWKLSAEESSDDESGDTPPSTHQPVWPATRRLFPWASQPATPYAGSSMSFGIMPMTKADTPVELIDSEPANAAPSSPELQYKRLFHQGAVHDEQPDDEDDKDLLLRRRSVSSIALDPSGTRGMMRRRKLSLSVGLAQQQQQQQIQKQLDDLEPEAESALF